MNFAMKTYWLFLAVVVVGVWCLPVRLRKAWLLVASYVCYAAWSVPYCALLVGAAALNHFGAAWIIRGDRDRRGKVVVAGNLLLLGVFKYLAWVLGMFTSAATWFGVQLSLPIPKWVLPLGISFYLFESISYIVDVMRKREKVHSFWDFQLFIAFFPKLVSGPILRAKEFLPQVERELHLRTSDVRFALRHIAIGLFLKLVIADSIAKIVDQIFSRPIAMATAIDAWIMGIGFGLQVYLDFSAYTRLAIGSAKLCGIDLVPNFDHPFISRSPAEFWQRWHMSLSRWVRDYLFYPLTQRSKPIEGSSGRVKLVKRLILVRAAFVSMVIFGIWHGASFTYLGYGVYHGVVLAAYHVLTYRERPTRPAPRTDAVARLRGVLGGIAGWAVTFALMIIGFLIPRPTSISDSLVLIGRALRPFTYPGRTFPDFVVFRILGLLVAVLLAGWIAQLVRSKKRATSEASPGPLGYAWAAAEGLGIGALLVIALLEMTGTNASFVYFQF